MGSPDHQLPPLDFLALAADRPDELRITGLNNLSPDEFVSFVAGVAVQKGIHVAFEYGARRDDALEQYRDGLRLTRAEMIDFAASEDCEHPLAPKGVAGAWNALRKTHAKIQDARKGKGSGVWVGRRRSLDAKQIALFKTLPLAFVTPDTDTLERNEAEGCQLLVPSLYDTLDHLKGRSDRTDFFEGVSTKTMLFLGDLASCYSPGRPPLRLADR